MMSLKLVKGRKSAIFPPRWGGFFALQTPSGKQGGAPRKAHVVMAV
jgi:hypothetical protein